LDGLHTASRAPSGQGSKARFWGASAAQAAAANITVAKAGHPQRMRMLRL
jgi:hypothetical protein